MTRKELLNLVNTELNLNLTTLNWIKVSEHNIPEDFLVKNLQEIYKLTYYKSYYRTNMFIAFLQNIFRNKNMHYSDEFIYSTFKYYFADQFSAKAYFPEEFYDKWIEEYPNQAKLHFADILYKKNVSIDFINRHIDLLSFLIDYNEYKFKRIFEFLLENYKLAEEFIEKHFDLIIKHNLFFHCIRYQNISEDFIEKHFAEIRHDILLKYKSLSSEFIEKHYEYYFNNYFEELLSNVNLNFIINHFNDIRIDKDKLNILLWKFKLPISFITVYFNDIIRYDQKEAIDYLLNNQELSPDFIDYLDDEGYLPKFNDKHYWNSYLDKPYITEAFINKHFDGFTFNEIIRSKYDELSEEFYLKNLNAFIKSKYAPYIFYSDERDFSSKFIETLAPYMTNDMWRTFSNNKLVLSKLSDEFIYKYKNKIKWNTLINSDKITIDFIKKIRKYIPNDVFFRSNKIKEYVETCSADEIKSMLFEAIEEI